MTHPEKCVCDDCCNERRRSNRIELELLTLPSTPKAWYWVSFVGDEGFLGVCVVEAHKFHDDKLSVGSALKRCWELKINPGGSTRTLEIPPDKLYLVPEHARNRCLSKTELIELGLISE